jgi:hypothetical protein
MQPLLGDLGEDILDTVLPGLPFLIICLSEGRHVFMNKKTADEAFANASNRAVKSGLAIGAGILTTYFTSFSIHGATATFLTRYLFNEEEKEKKVKEFTSLLSKKKPELLLLKASFTK